MAVGLTQVLSDNYDNGLSSSTYVYGLNRIAVEDSAGDWYTYQPDALGSVRQLSAQDQSVTYGVIYAPYGDVIDEYGTASSNYGFAGEWTDNTGMQYLRARYYAPNTGRFITSDLWDGDEQQLSVAILC